MNERELILSRIRESLRDVAAEEPSAWQIESDSDPAVRYHRGRGFDPALLVELFAERCDDYRATVSHCQDQPASIAEAVATAAGRHGALSFVAAPGWPDDWSRLELEVRLDDPPLSISELDAVDGVLSTCAVAIAETGTIVLDGGAGQGRRALTLIPDLHICVVRVDQIVAGVPEGVERVAGAVRANGSPLTWVSGPSATSDIELRRVEGVHGPRRLEVIVAS